MYMHMYMPTSTHEYMHMNLCYWHSVTGVGVRLTSSNNRRELRDIIEQF